MPTPARRNWSVPTAIVLCLWLPSPARAQTQLDAPQLARARFDKAVEYAKAKDFDRARQEAAEAVRLAPSESHYLAYRGYLENRYGNPAEGLRLGLEAARLDPAVGWYTGVVMEGAYGSLNDPLARSSATRIVRLGPKGTSPEEVELARRILDMLSPHTYRLTWTIDPKKKGWTGRSVVELALPARTPDQEVTFQVAGAVDHTVVARGGGEALHAEVDDQTPLTLTATVTVRPTNYKTAFARYRKTAPLPDDVKPFLGKSDRIDPTNPRIVRIAAGLKAYTPLATVRNVQRWLEKAVTYKAKVGAEYNEFKTLDELLDRRHTKCDGFSALFVALCRAAGVPAREVWGYVKTTREFAPDGYLGSHMWAEFYLPGGEWVVVEPQRIGDLGHSRTDYVRMIHQDAASGRVDQTKLFCTEPRYVEQK